MSIYSDDFQSYATGSNAPFGSFNNFGFFNSSIVTSPAGIRGKSKCVEIPALSLLSLATLTYYPAISVWSGFYITTWEQTLFEVFNDLTSVCAIITNPDGTIAIKSGATYICISEVPLTLYKWLWLQLNVTVTDVGGFLFVSVELGYEGNSIAVGSVLTGISTAGMAAVGLNAFNYARFNQSHIYVAEFTLDSFTAIGTDPNPGAATKEHITQALAEVQQVPDSALVNVTQGIIEVGILPSTALVRITQGLIELYIKLTPARGNNIYEA